MTSGSFRAEYQRTNFEYWQDDYDTRYPDTGLVKLYHYVLKHRFPANAEMPWRVLDYGCSTGSNALFLSDTGVGYAQVDGVELAPLKDVGDVQCHLDGDQRVSLHHMATADVLVSCPSSFSFNPGLLNHGMNLIRSPWWLSIPGDWFLCEDSGLFDTAGAFAPPQTSFFGQLSAPLSRRRQRKATIT